MASGVGPSPFAGGGIDINNESEVAMLRKRHGKRMNRESLHSRGEEKKGRVQYNDDGLAQSSGYWKRPTRPPMKTLVDSLTGKTYQTPDVIDWDDWVDMFHIQGGGEMSDAYKSNPSKDTYRTLADYCNFAFDRPGESSFYTFECPEGHIKRVDYNYGTRIMRVNFKKYDRWCCYFFVPTQIYETLKKLSEGMPVRMGYGNVPRHLVGIYFWDLVRVRGTIHGNRYECCYTTAPDGGFRKVEHATRDDVVRMLSEDSERTSGKARQIEGDAGADAAKPMYDLSEEYARKARNILDEGKKGDGK